MRSGQFKGVPVPRKAKKLKVFGFGLEKQMDTKL